MFFLEINMVSCSNPKFLHASPTDLGLKNQIDYELRGVNEVTSTFQKRESEKKIKKLRC